MQCVGEVAASASVIAQYAPELDPCDRVFDARTSTSMTTPCTVPEDAAAMEDWRDELGDASIAAVREDTAVLLAQRLDLRATVVHRIVAIAWTARGDRDDLEIMATHEQLSVAGVAVVLGLGGAGVVAGWNQRAIYDPRPASVTAR